MFLIFIYIYYSYLLFSSISINFSRIILHFIFIISHLHPCSTVSYFQCFYNTLSCSISILRLCFIVSFYSHFFLKMTLFFSINQICNVIVTVFVSKTAFRFLISNNICCSSEMHWNVVFILRVKEMHCRSLDFKGNVRKKSFIYLSKKIES